MVRVSIEDLKTYLRLDDDSEDFLLQAILDSAISQCETMLNRPILEQNMTEETKLEVPKQVEIAILLLSSHWYEQRALLTSGDNQKGKSMPYGIESILRPYTFRQV